MKDRSTLTPKDRRLIREDMRRELDLAIKEILRGCRKEWGKKENKNG